MQTVIFKSIIEKIYSLPLNDRLEIQNLLENNIVESRRNEIFNNFKKTKNEYKSGKLEFSSNISDLKKML